LPHELFVNQFDNIVTVAIDGNNAIVFLALGASALCNRLWDNCATGRFSSLVFAYPYKSSDAAEVWYSPDEKHSRFTFGDQVLDNMFWSLASSVPIWIAWLTYFYIAFNGWVSTLESVSTTPVWFVLLFFDPF